MISNAFGIIYTGGDSMRLKDLAYSRSVAAVPFGGRYRCIDFIMSNMVNSGITNVGIIAQKNYHSLMDHLGSGKEWDLHRKRDGLFMLPPFVTRDNIGMYNGTVDALKSVSGYIRRSSQMYAVFASSYTIFNCSFNDMIEQHIRTGADITIMYNEEYAFDIDSQYEDLRLTLNEHGQVVDMEHNPYRPSTPNKGCGVYLLEKTLLEYLVEEAAAHGRSDFVDGVLLNKIDKLRIYGYKYDGFVARLDSPNSYFASNMALLDPAVRKDLFNEEHAIYTKVKDEVPARFGAHANVKNCIIADGCVIDGEVENSVLFRGVHIARGAKVKNCILMQATQIQENTELNYAVLDKSVIVKRGRRLSGHETFPVLIRKATIV
ncbi:glucose-1-phosphate adenylyltransferase subunit GlgD [Christensenellaceae bacterium OttesenSCG-928-L17]|nr:glucose-1-phosphate adenylyltransferase subunit GlgD [Christensenellaceae bacterium OttesenSCG-928-L17]